jgi:hypothetical protein
MSELSKTGARMKKPGRVERAGARVQGLCVVKGIEPISLENLGAQIDSLRVLHSTLTDQRIRRQLERGLVPRKLSRRLGFGRLYAPPAAAVVYSILSGHPGLTALLGMGGIAGGGVLLAVSKRFRIGSSNERALHLLETEGLSIRRRDSLWNLMRLPFTSNIARNRLTLDRMTQQTATLLDQLKAAQSSATELLARHHDETDQLAAKHGRENAALIRHALIQSRTH